jgi:molecular chaperone DnaK (HSP70)
MNEVIIGIDLGTTNSEVAMVAQGVVTVIEDNGVKILPSVVGIADDGALLVGAAAKNQYQLYPERTVKSIKRRMGEETTVDLGGNSYAPQEISAMILRRLKQVAEQHLGCPVHKAVITVPAYFSDSQRQATREAGELAGLTVVKIINEPTAAALAYESGHQGHKRILVYDLGGGTFDVSVVTMEDGVIEVAASHGNNHLGGDDFDQCIIDHIVDHLRAEHGQGCYLSAQAMARIDRAAEAAKVALSDQPFVLIAEEYLLEKDGVPIHLSLELSRTEYETMILPFIEETMQAMHVALDGAKLTVSDIDEILLVGGSTRTPLVSERLHEEFGHPPRQEVDPDLCVAAGAAIQAAMLAGDAVSAVLVDITPYTFGTRAFHVEDGIPDYDYFVPVIRKNTPIPVTKTEVFYTMHDDQDTVEVRVYQGEQQKASKNIMIGKFMVEGLSKGMAGNEVLIKFQLDSDGILHVTSWEKKTGLSKKITIANSLSRFEGEELATAKERINRLFGDELDDDDLEAGGDEPEQGSYAADGGQGHREIAKARALLEKAEKVLESASVEDRDEMVNLMEIIRDGLSADDPLAMVDAVEELADILYYLEA